MTGKISGNIVDIVNQKIFPGTIKINKNVISEISKDICEYKNYIMPGFVDSLYFTVNSHLKDMKAPENSKGSACPLTPTRILSVNLLTLGAGSPRVDVLNLIRREGVDRDPHRLKFEAGNFLIHLLRN